MYIYYISRKLLSPMKTKRLLKNVQKVEVSCFENAYWKT